MWLKCMTSMYVKLVSDAVLCVPEGWSSHSLNVSQQNCSSGYCSGSCGCHWKNHWSHLEIKQTNIKITLVLAALTFCGNTFH